MTFIVKSHGGFCCGMTHIYDFSGTPEGNLPAHVHRTNEAQAEWLKNHQMYYGSLNVPYPEQTKGDRLKQIVDEITNGRTPEYYGYKNENAYYGYELICPKERSAQYKLKANQPLVAGRKLGIVEVVLVATQEVCWGEFLLGLGFVLVNKHKNSNTSNTLFVYHLNTGDK